MSTLRAIIVVTLDCVRPDHLGFNGYRGVDTPNIDLLAHEGVVFEQAIAQAPNTWVSHASIFTGCNPYKHGIRTPFTRLSRQVTTVAEAFSEYGFATAAFPAHTLLGPAQGFDRGFEMYDLDINDFSHASMAKDHRFYRNWETMWTQAKKWMLEQSGRFFIWLHYMGTHWEPHKAVSLPEEYRHKYSKFGQYYDGKISWADKECIGTIRSFLEETNLSEDSCFVVLSDHGDELSRNDPPYTCGGHNQDLSDQVMKITLIIRAPRKLPQQFRVKEQVRSIDIMPTVLDLADVSIPESVEGKSLFSYCEDSIPAINYAVTAYAYMENVPRHWLGIRTSDWKLILTDQALSIDEKTSVLPKSTVNIFKAIVKSAKSILLISKEHLHPWVYTVLKTFYHGVRRTYQLFLAKKQPKQKSQLASKITTQPLQFETMLLERGRVFALYNLRNDPNEHQDVAVQHPDVVQLLKAQLANMAMGATSESLDISDVYRAETEQQLKSLGYF